MAILAGLPGVVVKVYVGDTEATEYSDPGSGSPTTIFHGGEDDYRKTTNYIQSEAGKEFSIRLAIGEPYELDTEFLGIFVYLNKKECVRKFVKWDVYDACTRTGKDFKCKIEGIHNKAGGIQHFKFIDVETTEDEDALRRVEQDRERMAEVGEIEVEFFRMNSIDEQTGNGYQNLNKIEVLQSAIHEKALKGQPLYHSVGLSPAKPASSQPKSLPIGKMHAYPFASFCFKYRSEKALKHEMIIERTPEPDEINVDANNFTPEERRQLAEYAKLLLTQRPNHRTPIKRERDESDEHEEITPSRKKRAKKSAAVEVIDLSDD